MAHYDNFYSKLIAWMKIILPLGALALLSTLFLISNNVDPTVNIPFTQIDLEQRAQDLGVTNPSFAGVTGSGDQITFEAKRARPDPENADLLLADEVVMQILLTAGTVIDITSLNADMNQDTLTANLDGDVHITTNTGYVIDTDALFTRFDQLYAETPGPITGTGLSGDLTAGRMLLTTDEATGHAQLLFTDGVKLLYKPQVTKE